MSETPACDLPPAHQNNSNGSSGAVPALRSQDLESTFELLLTLVYPSKRVCTSSKKTKNTKPELDNKGPYNVPINIEWDAFLGVVSEKLMVVPSTLIVTSFEWHWLKPASSPWLPIQDEKGFVSMLKKVKTKSDPIWKILTKFQRRYIFQVIAVGLLLNFHRQNWMTHSRRLSQNSPKSTLQNYVIITRIVPVFIIACQTCISTSLAHDCLSGHRPSNPNAPHTKQAPNSLPSSRHHWPSNLRQKMPKKRRTLILLLQQTRHP